MSNDSLSYLNPTALPQGKPAVESEIDLFLQTPIDSYDRIDEFDFSKPAPAQKMAVNHINVVDIDVSSRISHITKKFYKNNLNQLRGSNRISGLPDIARREKEKDESKLRKRTFEPTFYEPEHDEDIYPLRKDVMPSTRRVPANLVQTKKRAKNKFRF